jgi:hypothetical protein
MKNRHRVSQAVNKLICSRAIGARLLKRARRIAVNIAKLPELGRGPEIGPKTGPHSIAKITTGHGRPLWRSRGGSLRQPSRPISPNVLDLGNEFMGMREAFFNLAQ